MARGRAFAALRQHLEAQRAGEGRGFDQPHLDRVAEPEGLAAARADQGAARLLEAVIVGAEAAGGDEAVGAGVAQAHEQADARHAGDARAKRAPT